MIERIESIDVLRGFALLGILMMNIAMFSMPFMAYFSPNVYDITIPNHIVYSLTHVIADQKFMAIFSMLFGASTMLFVKSAMSKKKRPMLLFYIRNFWYIRCYNCKNIQKNSYALYCLFTLGIQYLSTSLENHLILLPYFSSINH